MRYVVYGAGGIGGTIGGRLFHAGCDVVLIARGLHHDAIRAHGLELRGAMGTEVLPIPVVDHPGRLDLGPDDVVLLAMKTQHTEVALDALAATAHPAIAVVCAQNGVANERFALRRFANVHGMSVALPAAHLEPGVVECYAGGAWGILDVGRYPDGLDAVDEQLVADLVTAGFAATADATVMGRKYAKLLLMNLANVLEAASGRDGVLSELTGRAQEEARTVFAAAGIEPKVDDEAERRTAMRLAPIDGQHRGGGSTWQSLARGATDTEVDYLNGEIVLLGRLHGVPTPVNEGLQHLGWRLAHDHIAPGTVPIAEVIAAIG